MRTFNLLRLSSIVILNLIAYSTANSQQRLVINMGPPQADTNGLFPASLNEGLTIKKGNGFKGIPKKEGVELYRFDFDLDQQFYSNYLKGLIPYKRFLKIIEYSHSDTLNFYRGSLRNFIYGIHYYDSTFKRGVVVLDQNYDKNFANDVPIYSYDSAGKQFPKILIKGIQIYNDKHILNDPLIVQPAYSPLIISSTDTINGKVKTIVERHPFSLRLFPFIRNTIFLIDSNKYKISFNSEDGLYKGYSSRNPWFLKYYPLPETGDINVIPYLSKDDNILLGSKIYRIDSVTYDGSKLFLDYEGNNPHHTGYMPGFNAGLINGTDIRDSKEFSSKNIGNKWMLLDFWGTWCGPCKASIPKLRELSKKFEGRLEIISIACEKGIKADSVRSFADKDDMKWIQFYEQLYNNDPHSFENRFNVKAYPTFILINPKGKICLRGTGENYTTVLNDYLFTIGD